MYLTNIRIYNYRSFTTKGILNELKKVNILIGKNNSGKSNVLKFMSMLNEYTRIIAHQSSDNKELLNENMDLNKNVENDVIKFSIKVSLDKFPYLKQYLNIHLPNYTEKLGNSLLIPFDYFFKVDKNSTRIIYGNIAFDYDSLVEELSSLYSKEELLQSEYKKFNNNFFLDIKSYLRTTIIEIFKFEKDTVQSNINPFSDIVSKKCDELKEISKLSSIYIDSHRLVNEKNTELMGRNIYELISEIRDPNIEKDHLRNIHKKVNNFIDFILNVKGSEITVNHEKNSIYLNINNQRLPLQSWGEGVQQIVILGLIIIMNSNKLICMEEPESFLHPEMQKRLIYYINEYTENQYLISTHSNIIFDNDFVQIYHLIKKGNCSIINQAINNVEKRKILKDLGCKASDILQSNCIIWVEGPSDRIYINKWISEKNKNLIEGIHYSIMFYGGKLLSHLSIDDKEKKLINLSQINQNLIIIMDSDITSSNNKINNTKRRVENEVKNNGNYCWITEGKEIENYIETSMFKKFVKEIHSDYNNNNFSSDNCITRYKPKDNGECKYIDKVKLAEKITKEWTSVSKNGALNLECKVNEITEFIMQANGILIESDQTLLQK